MRAHRWLGALTMCTGGLLAAVVFSAGCGGKSEADPVVEDTAPIDTGIAILMDSSTPVDTGTAKDSAEEFDVPGSLFDAEIPDVTLEGGTTVKGCYDCTTDKCHDQVAECDKDTRCRGLLLCVLTTCSGFADMGCLFGCALTFGVSDLSDPVVATLQSVATCNQSMCSASCPALPVDGGPPADAKSDVSSSDATSTDATSSDATADAPSDTKTDGGSGGSPFAPKLPAKDVDPKVIEVIQSAMVGFSSTPLATKGLVDHLSH